jgi:hypothetical protein
MKFMKRVEYGCVGVIESRKRYLGEQQHHDRLQVRVSSPHDKSQSAYNNHRGSCRSNKDPSGA